MYFLLKLHGVVILFIYFLKSFDPTLYFIYLFFKII